MSVLITGGAGYIGSHTAWEFVEQDEQIVIIDNLVTGFDWAMPPNATFVLGNIGDRALVEHTLRQYDIDTIVHFAGSVVVPESIQKPLKYYDNNTGCTRHLLESAVRCGIDQFIFSSTAAVYRAPQTLEPVNENAPLEPASPYGMSKLMSEMMIRDVCAAHGMRHVILRYFNVAGADPQGRTGLSTRGATHVMKLACEAAVGKRDHFEVYGTDYDTPDGSAIRDFIHVTDLATAHYDALNFLRSGGNKFTGNVGYGKGHSVFDIINAVKQVSGCDFEVRLEPRRTGDIAAIVADPSHMQHRLKWAPIHTELEQIVEHALAWERKTLAMDEHHEPAPLAPEFDNLMDKITLI
ncbi:MAG: UDP-glucose 4-epimerase GalE [Rhizobiaceae bacterium]|nr:UDP-glucose 4-epimerase GalE [Rhizobiaceae bacterium]